MGADRYRTGSIGEPRVPDELARMQGAAEVIGSWAFRWHSRLKVTGREHVPRAGSAVIAANHQSMMDIPLLVIASSRRIHFLAKDVIHKGPISTRFFVELGGYPLRREGVDARAMHVALRILERGDVVGIYPEGTRNKTPQLLTFMGGAAWLAVRTGAPIVPCGMVGTGLWNDDASATVFSTIRRRNVRIAFGPPIAVKRELSPRARKERIPEITRELTDAVAHLVSGGSAVREASDTLGP